MYEIYYTILKGLNMNSPVQNAGKTKQHFIKNTERVQKIKAKYLSFLCLITGFKSPKGLETLNLRDKELGKWFNKFKQEKCNKLIIQTIW